jgi:hypothetical protein
VGLTSASSGVAQSSALAVGLGGAERSAENPEQLVGFSKQSSCRVTGVGIGRQQEAQPEHRLVGLLDDHSKFGDELPVRAASAGCLVVSPDGSAGAKQLSSHESRVPAVRQLTTESDDIHAESEPALTKGRELLLRHEQPALQVAFLSRMTGNSSSKQERSLNLQAAVPRMCADLETHPCRDRFTSSPPRGSLSFPGLPVRQFAGYLSALIRRFPRSPGHRFPERPMQQPVVGGALQSGRAAAGR